MALASEEGGRKACKDHHENDGALAFDDQTNEPLIPLLVRTARLEKMKYLREMQVYDKVGVEQCMKVTGSKPIGVCWVDAHKGDSAQPDYRAKLLAK